VGFKDCRQHGVGFRIPVIQGERSTHVGFRRIKGAPRDFHHRKLTQHHGTVGHHHQRLLQLALGVIHLARPARGRRPSQVCLNHSKSQYLLLAHYLFALGIDGQDRVGHLQRSRVITRRKCHIQTPKQGGHVGPVCCDGRVVSPRGFVVSPLKRRDVSEPRFRRKQLVVPPKNASTFLTAPTQIDRLP